MAEFRDLIVKSNYIVEASYRLSLGEQRVIYVLTSMISQNDEEFKPYKLTVKEFAEILETKSKNMYTQVAKYIDTLRERDLTIVKEKSVLKTKWLSSAEYFVDSGYVELCFDPKLKPYLLMLKERFTKLSLEQMVSFNSQYSARIYEILKQYERIGERTFTIEELRRLLVIDFNEYPKYANFKQKVILKAINEINSNSDLVIKFEEIKTARKITSIKFNIKSNKEPLKTENLIDDPNEKIDKENIKTVQAIFTKHTITKDEARYILKDANNNLELIKQCYSYALGKNIENIVGYIRKLVRGFCEPKKNIKQGTFNNYPQRKYDFDELERKLLGLDFSDEDLEKL